MSIENTLEEIKNATKEMAMCLTTITNMLAEQVKNSGGTIPGTETISQKPKRNRAKKQDPEAPPQTQVDPVPIATTPEVPSSQPTVSITLNDLRNKACAVAIEAAKIVGNPEVGSAYVRGIIQKCGGVQKLEMLTGTEKYQAIMDGFNAPLTAELITGAPTQPQIF